MSNTCYFFYPFQCSFPAYLRVDSFLSTYPSTYLHNLLQLNDYFLHMIEILFILTLKKLDLIKEKEQKQHHKAYYVFKETRLMHKVETNAHESFLL